MNRFSNCSDYRNKFSDYSGYINSLKYNTNNTRYLGLLENKLTILNNKINTMESHSSENIYKNFDWNTKDRRIIITSEKYSTYIQPTLDVSNNSRIYNLEATPSILNGTPKIIINNIDLEENTSVQIYCVNPYNEGGFFSLNNRYNNYIFALKGENLELIWNSSINAWNVLKYDSMFQNI